MTEMIPNLRGRIINTAQKPPKLLLPQADSYATALGIKDIESKLRPDANSTDRLEVAVDLDGLFAELSGRYGTRYGKKPTTLFRSYQLPVLNQRLLTKTDYGAHFEAAWSEGFIYYFMGQPKDRISMSFCPWESAEEAMLASKKPKHLRAMRLASRFYESAFVEHLIIDYSPQGISVSDLRPPTVIPYNTTMAEAEQFWATAMSLNQ